MIRYLGFVVLLAVAGAAAGMGYQAGSPLSSPHVEAIAVPQVAVRPWPQKGAAATEPVAEPAPAAKEPAAEPPAPEPQPVAETKPVAEPKPVAKPVEPPAPARPAAAAVAKTPKPASETGDAPAVAGDGLVNLKASDTAEIVVDGRKLGPSPRMNVKLKAGKHKVRFDCYDAEGSLKAGKVQTIDVAPDSQQDVDYECPAVE